jgi:hypothetical protein
VLFEVDVSVPLLLVVSFVTVVFGVGLGGVTGITGVGGGLGGVTGVTGVGGGLGGATGGVTVVVLIFSL